MARAKLSVCIIAANEADRIGLCLESTRWADEIVVVDSGSQDDTPEIARRAGARVVFNPWPGYVAQKNVALGHATGEWVLCLDADERATPELHAEIEEVLAAPPDAIDGYWIRRRTRYLGRWILHGGWYPDAKVRLVRRRAARWGGVDPHDKLLVEGSTANLRGEIHHETYRSFSHQLAIIDRFSSIPEQRRGRAFRPPWLVPAMALHPIVKFVECYVWKRGFLDGLPGFIIAVASAFYVFAKYVKAWESRRSVTPT